MQKREKILVGVLGVVLLIFLLQQTSTLFNAEEQSIIKEYGTSDLQKFLGQPQLELSEKLKIKGSTRSDFFYRPKKQSAPKPILNEIILGPVHDQFSILRYRKGEGDYKARVNQKLLH